MTAALVLGGGLAGLLAASVLARHVAEVTVIEGGTYPAGPQIRAGVPQARHNHVLVAGGAQALESLLPGITATLLDRGARRIGLPDGALIRTAQGWFRRRETGAYLIACSRALLDDEVRRQVLSTGHVQVAERTRAIALTGTASQVDGVVTRGRHGQAERVRADLVIDAMGRGSAAPRWLDDIGGPRVEELAVESGLAYSTSVMRPPAALAATVPAIMIHPQPGPGQPDRGATLFPVEDGRWFVTLTTGRDGHPPATEAQFSAFARALPSPLIAELTATARPVSEIRVCRGTANRRRFYERATLPAGFLALGDSLVALNPVYSHGMSAAILGATRLAEELTRHAAAAGARAALPAALVMQAAIAAEADRPWQLAIAQDATHPTAARPPGTAGATQASRPFLASPRQGRDGSPGWRPRCPVAGRP
jgi:flavin-dependent dehydrogenase